MGAATGTQAHKHTQSVSHTSQVTLLICALFIPREPFWNPCPAVKPRDQVYAYYHAATALSGHWNVMAAYPDLDEVGGCMYNRHAIGMALMSCLLGVPMAGVNKHERKFLPVVH